MQRDRCGSDEARQIQWFVWRSRGNEPFHPLGTFAADTAEEATERAVEAEIQRLPVGQCSGMYFACPDDMLTRRDFAVSYEKRLLSRVGGTQNA